MKKRAVEIRAEYDFSGGVRGKYAARFARGTNVVLLDPELTAAFPDSKSVNDALRALLAIANRPQARKRG
ncbi:MAG: hypothetical protein ACR2NN_20145 [Bryobacteraceae bacterium]